MFTPKYTCPTKFYNSERFQRNSLFTFTVIYNYTNQITMKGDLNLEEFIIFHLKTIGQRSD